jgi:hypothetical protein
VNAALYGRVLILEGLEKAEKNILPILVCLSLFYVLDKLTENSFDRTIYWKIVK